MVAGDGTEGFGWPEEGRSEKRKMSFSMASEGSVGEIVCLALSTESMVESDGLLARL